MSESSSAEKEPDAFTTTSTSRSQPPGDHVISDGWTKIRLAYVVASESVTARFGIE